MSKIAFFYAKPYDRDFFEKANQKYGFSITYIESPLTPGTVAFAKDHDVVCLSVKDAIDVEILDKLLDENIQLIALRSAGYDHIDLKSVPNRLPVVRVPDYSPYAVAEHAVGLMLCLNRKLYKSYDRTRNNNFSIEGLLGFDMNGKTAGIIGLGRIGKKVASILKGMGMRVIFHDHIDDPEIAKCLNIHSVGIDQLYEESDIITLHCPLDSKNKHIINNKSFDKMKKGVMLINTGRGGLINTLDLIHNLKNNKIGCAGLDVYEKEADYFHEDYSDYFIADDALSRLLTFPNVMVTAHQAFFTKEALTDIA